MRADLDRCRRGASRRGGGDGPQVDGSTEALMSRAHRACRCTTLAGACSSPIMVLGFPDMPAAMRVRADRRVRDRHPPRSGGRRHAALHGPRQLGEPALRTTVNKVAEVRPYLIRLSPPANSGQARDVERRGLGGRDRQPSALSTGSWVRTKSVRIGGERGGAPSTETMTALTYDTAIWRPPTTCPIRPQSSRGDATSVTPATRTDM